MKTFKNKKIGVSLIVLIITIIVMIILAGTVVLTLSNSGIISKSIEAVSKANLKQIQEMASVSFGEAYIEIHGERTVEELNIKMMEKLKEKGITDKELAKYTFNVTTAGVEVAMKTDNGEIPNKQIILSKTTIVDKLKWKEVKNVELEATYTNITGDITWSSSDEEVAEVQEGTDNKRTIALKKSGTATITVSAEGIESICKVTVTDDMIEFKVIIQPYNGEDDYDEWLSWSNSQQCSVYSAISGMTFEEWSEWSGTEDFDVDYSSYIVYIPGYTNYSLGYRLDTGLKGAYWDDEIEADLVYYLEKTARFHLGGIGGE